MPELPPPPQAPAPPADRVRTWLIDRWGALPSDVRRRVVGGCAGAAVLLVAIVLIARPAVGPPPEVRLPSAADPATPPVGREPVHVHAAGALARPGLYRLAAGSRVADLVEAAGGPLPEADVHQLNLAARLSDGDRVYVPRAGEVAAGDEPGPASEGTGGRLDLNAATQAQLEDLPGVGPATATAILDERKRRGRFKSVEELLEVRGIGPAKLEQLRDLVRV